MDFIRSHKLIVATIIIQIIALPIIILLLRTEQTTRSQTQAAQSTILYFTPDSSSNAPIQKNVGDIVSLDLMLDPGENLVSTAKIEIIYDSAILEPDSDNPININSNSFTLAPTVNGVKPIVFEDGKITVDLNIGFDRTKVIQEITKVLTLNMKSLASTNQNTEIKIGQNTTLLSTDPQVASDDNVLDLTSLETPALIQITGDATNPEPEPEPEPDTPIVNSLHFLELNGRVTIEAEKNNGKFNRGGYRWDGAAPSSPLTGVQGYAGTGFISARPNDDKKTFYAPAFNQGPETTYNVCFVTIGTYHVWLRSSGPDAKSDSAHVGFDNKLIGDMALYYEGEGGANTIWQWKDRANSERGGGRVTLDVTTPGLHTFHIYMREDGTRIDRINLTTNANWVPTPGPASQGPSESSEGICNTDSDNPTDPPDEDDPTDPTGTILNINGLKLHGIGKGGDNPNPTGNGTQNPLRPSRNITVEFFNTSGTLVNKAVGLVEYSGPTTGVFNGIINVPTTIINGSYTIKISSPYYLTKLVPGFIDLVHGNSHDITTVALVAGDINKDNQLSVVDYDLIMDCYADLLEARDCANASKKTASDISDDGKVDQDDYNLFLRELSVQQGN